MPIQNTKFVRYNAQNVGHRLPLRPIPYHS
jgi:hypothetical protein